MTNYKVDDEYVQNYKYGNPNNWGVCKRVNPNYIINVRVVGRGVFKLRI